MLTNALRVKNIGEDVDEEEQRWNTNNKCLPVEVVVEERYNTEHDGSGEECEATARAEEGIFIVRHVW